MPSCEERLLGSDPGSVTVAWMQTYTKDDCYLMVNDALSLKEINDNVYNVQ